MVPSSLRLVGCGAMVEGESKEGSTLPRVAKFTARDSTQMLLIR
jgi:hypothetical protein